jgi:hypothetical protein
MANTVVSDVIVPEIYLQYLQEQTDKVSLLIRSGIVAQSPTFNSLVAGGGKTFNLPFWKPLTGSSEAIQSGTTLTVNNITTAKEIAVRCIRGKAWGAEDIAGELAGDDPMAAIASKTAVDFWAPDMQATLIASLKGVFLDNVAADSSDLTNDVSIEDGNNAVAANLAGSDAVIDTISLLGDMASKITAIAMHSVVYYNLTKLNLIDFEPTNTQDIGWGTYLGNTVIVDDTLPKVAGGTSGFKYTSYLFASGSVAMGEAPNEVPVETDRTALTGVDVLVERRNFTLHPRGFAFISGSVANETPTNTELALAANWNRVYEQKNTGIVQMITNG